MPALTPSSQSVLARATEPGAVFSAADIALVEPLATAVAPVQEADARFIRQSIGSLASALPAQAIGEVGGALKLNTYGTMLAGCDERALAYACRRCLAELDWFPTVKQIQDRLRCYVSPEQHAINVARYIVRNGPREQVHHPVEPMTDDEIRRMSPELRRMGLKGGHLTQEQVDRALAACVEEPPSDSGIVPDKRAIAA
jgi:hypothetical protein